MNAHYLVTLDPWLAAAPHAHNQRRTAHCEAWLHGLQQLKELTTNDQPIASLLYLVTIFKVVMSYQFI
jgi:hypothetical protein